mgnify:CR=1 FL=1
MLINCNSCLKKFTVPDSAIRETGRLLQCGSCGNKWTQYPIEKKIIKNIKKITPTQPKEFTNISRIKNSTKKGERKIKLYSEEYLKKKYNLTIKDTSSYQDKKIKISFGFYNYLIVTSIFFIALFGFLNLAADNIVMSYPFIVPYVNNLYEVIDLIKVSISELIN